MSEESRIISKTNEEWKQELTKEQYKVCRLRGTEYPFTGKYWNYKEDGTYRCVCCGNELFDSETKFDSGTGWPSFWSPAKIQNLKLRTRQKSWNTKNRGSMQQLWCTSGPCL